MAGETSATEVIANILKPYGLESLSALALDLDARGVKSEAAYRQAFQATPEYAARFPGMALRNHKKKAPITEDDYISMERNYAQKLRQRGVPSGFYDDPQTDFAAWIGEDVSAEEVDDRFEVGYQRVKQLPVSVQNYFRAKLGVAEGDTALAMYVMDPVRSLPLIQELERKAEVGGAAAQQGFDLSLDRAGEIAAQGADFNTASSGFAKLNQEADLFSETVGEVDDLTVDNEGVAAAFNLDGTSAGKLEKRKNTRLAGFDNKGGSQRSNEGLVGFGQAN